MNRKTGLHLPYAGITHHLATARYIEHGRVEYPHGKAELNGSDSADCYSHLLCSGHRLWRWLPEAAITMNALTLIALVCSGLLMVYLLVTLLFPEKF